MDKSGVRVTTKEIKMAVALVMEKFFSEAKSAGTSEILFLDVVQLLSVSEDHW